MKLLLDIGCGGAKHLRTGYRTIAVDNFFSSQADVIVNLEEAGLPFKDNCFDIINLSHVLEHLFNPIKLLGDARRTAKNGSILTIRVPHHSNFRAFDIFHKNLWNYFSFDSLCAFAGRDAQERKWFKIKKRRIMLQLSRGKFKSLGIFLEKIINHFPYKYESYLKHIFPAYEIFFELEVEK